MIDRSAAHLPGAEKQGDSELKTRVVNYLASRYRASLRRLRIETCDGAVTLRGEVPTFYEKQIAIHSCMRVAGVQKLIDEVQVAQAPQPPSHWPATI